MFLVSVTPLHFGTPLPTFASFNIMCTLYCARFLRYVSWRRLHLATPFSSWRRLLLATRMLGDACRLFRIFVFYLLTPWPCTSSGKKIKTEAKLFLNFSFFYLGDLVKKPPRGKKSVPYNKNFTWLFTYTVQLK